MGIDRTQIADAREPTPEVQLDPTLIKTVVGVPLILGEGEKYAPDPFTPAQEARIREIVMEAASPMTRADVRSVADVIQRNVLDAIMKRERR